MGKTIAFLQITIIGIMGIVAALVLLFGGGSSDENLPGGPLICRSSSGKQITAEELNKHLKNAFQNHANDFINAAAKNKIDVILLVAIAQHETGYGTSQAVKEKNNPGGIMDTATNMQTIRHFPTLAEGIDFMARNLYKNYISKGLTSIQQIGQKYAPVGATNDSNNLNRHWIPTVTKIANEMGGISGNCQLTGGIHNGPISGHGFQHPIKNPVLSSPFGPRWGRQHKGIDLAHPTGTEITAAAAGTVEFAKFGASGSGFGGYGNVVVINHHNGYWTLYGHMSKITVTEGTPVQRGQVIGLVGSTGNSTGPHLHFEIKTSFLFGQIDPETMLPPIPRRQ